ncbi:hypothetical protein ALC60_07246 [Trachymyrmex zeteki]|uniref:Uncharacterized protein n=1 Tax=Mycetomoellerius zeteki TaxID=64791 RepID=A0A151X0Y9_9HYME|nr:hypothetical protein ALC60_07246 [Trachymyrmex zeteki]
MSRTSNSAEVLGRKQSSSNRMFKVCFWDEHETTKRAELQINGMQRINHRCSKRTPLTTCSREESKQIKGILSGCSARQKTFEVGKVCSICTYYRSFFSLVEQSSKVLVHPRIKRNRTCFDKRRRHGTRWSIRLIHEPKKAARECPPQAAKHSRKFTVPNGISMLDRRVLNLQLTPQKIINHKFFSTAKIFFTEYFSYNIIMNFLHERHSRCVPLQDVTLRNISREEGYAPKQLLRF